MSSAVEPGDWESLDSWWAAYGRSRSVPRGQFSGQVVGIEQFTNWWDDLDSWWSTYTDSSAASRASTSDRVIAPDRLGECWDDLDPWWTIYTQTGYETAVQISDLLTQSNKEWASSEIQFDTDPLAGGLTGDQFSRGPLQPSTELEWSQWLARLLRSSGELVAELFDVPTTRSPNTVIREDRLSKRDGGSRRPDILVKYPDYGISIEVKLDDENYQKTAETARLVERHYDNRTWDHLLLLPKRQAGRLDSIVDAQLDRMQDGQPQIQWDDPAPVDVLFWQDITAAIRSVLQSDVAVDDHWAANAYLFCAIAEERLMNFQPQPVIERLAEPTNVVDTIQPIGMADALEEQLMYLRERSES